MPTGFNEKPYEYFKLKNEERIKKEEKHKWYESEIARFQYEDYPATKKRVINAERTAIISVVIAAIALLTPWICNKSDYAFCLNHSCSL